MNDRPRVDGRPPLPEPEGTPRRRPAPPWGLILAFVAVAVLSGAVSGAVVATVMDDDESRSSSPASATRAPRPEPAGDDPVAQAAAYALPAVVTIINEAPARQDAQGRLVQSVSAGSGVIVDERGFIVTNEHVIHDPGKLTVVLNDGQEIAATVVASDEPFTDLAVVRIPGGNLKALPWGESDDLVLGESVVAIGSALFEYRNSVSKGVVSGLGRRWLRNGIYMEDLVQTDAAINSGNSGGPLINLSGEVVGLVTNVVRDLGTNDSVFGISFAISSKTMRPIIQSIIDRGQYPRPYFGVDHIDIDPQVQAAGRLPIDHGALVQRVVDASPAERAGLRPGDVIVKIGQHDLNPEMPFLNALSRIGVNDRVPIQYFRAGRINDTTLQVTPR